MHLDLYTCIAMYRHEAEQTGKLLHTNRELKQKKTPLLKKKRKTPSRKYMLKLKNTYLRIRN